MDSDDSFTFGDPPLADDSTDEVYLIHGNEMHGPYSVVGVSVLRDSGELPEETQYWRKGMSGARPLAELADEIAATLPRPHHYAFAYKWLPMLVFGSPLSYQVRHSTTQQLLGAWGPAGQHFSPGNLDSSDGLGAEFVPFPPDSELLLITMPTPRRSAEACFVAIRSSVPDDPKKIRFFVLSYNDEEFGLADGCVRELTGDGENFRAQDFVRPCKDSFIAAVRELCQKDPDGSVCV